MISRISQSAREIYNTGGATMRNVWMGEKEDAIHLYYGELIENDSPMCGRDDEVYQKDGHAWDPYEPIEKDIVLRKTLTVTDPCTDEVQVTFIGRERRGHDATLRIVVNGNETLRPPSPVATPDARQYWDMAQQDGEWGWARWYYVKIPADDIQLGDNVIELSAADGAEGWQVMVGSYSAFHKGARRGEYPQHSSAKSTNGGNTWHTDNMGPEGDGVGEYVIRLDMRRYRASGWMISPVVDAAGQDDLPIKQPLQVDSVQLSIDAELPYHTGIIMSLRWGDTPYYDSGSWTDWLPVPLDTGPVGAYGRYVQWRAELYTDDRTVSPALRAVTIESEHEQAPATDDLRVIEFSNAEILRSSYEFSDEDYHHPKLRELREVCDLDKVIAGAEDDWEMTQRLMRWAYLIPLPNCIICPWDALKWIEINRDEDGEIIVNEYETRRRDRMCLYSNVLLAEMLLACGIPARHVNINSQGISGHEICEAWSNVHGKWIHLDATRDFYWIEESTGEPLSTLDVRQELVRHLDKPETWEDPHVFRLGAKIHEDQRIAAYEGGEWVEQEDAGDHIYQTMAHFRIVPRNDYYSQPYPLPVSQGAEVWGWDGYLNWADDMVPPLTHFSHHTNRLGDFYWTNNQAHMTLLRTGQRQLSVLLEHDMPNFARYEASIDGGEWAPAESGFRLELEPGITELAVRAVNTMDLPGPVSRAVVELAQ